MVENDTGKAVRNYTILSAVCLAVILALLLASYLVGEYAGGISVIIGVVAIGSVVMMFLLFRGFVSSLEQERRNQSNDDFLNRFTTNRFVERYGDMVQNTDKKYAFFFFCLLDFQEFNGQHDYAAGNEKLTEVCQTLQELSKPEDQFARCFGAHFEGLFCYESEREILDFIHILSDEVQDIDFSFGISLLPGTSGNVFFHEEKAQAALEKAKNEQKLYEIAKTVDKREWREAIIGDMNRALANNEFKMFLQPQYDLKKNQVCGAEALVRWIKEDGCVLFPQDMIALFEETGFIVKLDLAILRQACAKISEWIQAGYTPIPISINISKLHILNRAFIKSLYDMIREYKIPTHLLEFDISQTSISVTVDKLMDLNDQFDGREALVSFDDFGKGTSSIKVLQDLPGNTIRCNGELFTIAYGNPKIFDVLRKMIDVFHKQQVKIVAENIETELQIETIKKLNCHYAQGFYFSKPVLAAEFDKIAFPIKQK